MDERIVRLRLRRQQLRDLRHGRDAALALSAQADQGRRRVLAEAQAGRMLDGQPGVVMQGVQQGVATAQAADRVRADAHDALAGGLRVEEAVEADDAVNVGFGHPQAMRDSVHGFRADVSRRGLHVPEHGQQRLTSASRVGGEEGVE